VTRLLNFVIVMA